MKNKFLNELLIIILLTILFDLIVYYTSLFPLRLILGLPVLLLFPGFALLSALFPRRNALGSTEWITYSLAVSIAVVALIGIILNYTPWGITLDSGLIANSVFIIAATAFAWVRRLKLTEEERGAFTWHFRLPFDKNQRTADKVISGALLLAVIGVMVTMIYAYAAPQKGEKLTKFYILGPDGKAAEYTCDLKVGEEGTVIVGIINQEYETATYRVLVTLDGIMNSEIKPFILADGEKWEEQVAYVPDKVGDKQRLEFFLYKDGNTEPYLKPLRLWLNVTP